MPETTPPTKLQVFLCHSHGDKATVLALYERLKAESWLYPWLDEEEILGGQKWEIEIPKAVTKSDIILVCLSKNSINKKGFVQREIGIALDRATEMPSGTIYIVPLRLEDCDIPERLAGLHCINYYDARGYERLLRTMRHQAGLLGITLETTPPAPVIHNLEPSVQTPPVQKEPAIVTPVKPTATPLQSEQERLLAELESLNTNHQRRLEIGERLSEIGDTRAGIGVRPDGTPDIKWLLVNPGGSVQIKGKNYAVQPFWIAKYPVTCAQFAAFENATDGFSNLDCWKDAPKEYQRQKLDNRFMKPGNYPRDNISWYQSMAFARWLNQRLYGWQFPVPNANPLVIGENGNAEIRLPNEWEWQWAAQGGREQREYPWGQWLEGYANIREAGLGKTTAVGMYPQGAAACGALDMSGTLWEWCLNKYSSDNSYPVLRGGAFSLNSHYASAVYRNGYHPHLAYLSVGVRVVVAGLP